MKQLPDPEFWRNKRVFVTGAFGFKGKWLVQWLQMMGSDVSRLPEDVDIRDASNVREYLAVVQPEIAILMAAITTVAEASIDPVDTLSVNAVGTMILLDCLKDVPSIKAIINVTTDKVYHIDGIRRGYVEEDTLGGLEPYSVSKASAELVCTMYQRTYKLPLATVRAGNVVGGGDWKRSRLVPNYFYALKEHTVLDVNVDAIRPWQYVLDALRGYLLLAEKLFDNVAYVGAWNFASNEYESRSVLWLVNALNDYAGPVLCNLIDNRGFYETKNLTICSEKAHKHLNWKPAYSMEEMIRNTALWYLRHDRGESEDSLRDIFLIDYIRAVSEAP